MQSDTPFKDILREYIEIKNLNVNKLSDETGIPERYIEAMLNGGNNELPPAPYIRGYIGKLAASLDFDKEEMWRIYKKENLLDGSVNIDRLPSNRFAVKKYNIKIITFVFLGILLATYVIWNVNRLLIPTPLELTYPAAENIIVNKNTVTIEGKTDKDSKLTINGEEVFVDEDGRFKKEYTLNFDINNVEIEAKRFLGKENKIVRKIIYQPPLPKEEKEDKNNTADIEQ